MDAKIKHLEFIQSVISRMANNSFLLKSWSVVLVSALFVLSAKDAEKTYALLALLPILVFWGLDAYYLWLERLFRKLYRSVSDRNTDQIDFSMDLSHYKGSVQTQICSWLDAVISHSVCIFHLSLLIATFIVSYTGNN